jgi:formate/nitrite transporter FocA (FNT family)
LTVDLVKKAADAGVGKVIIVFTNTELFTSNNIYLTISSVAGLDDLEAGCTIVVFLLFSKSCRCYRWRRLSRPIVFRPCIVRRRLVYLGVEHSIANMGTFLSSRDVGSKTRGGHSVAGCVTLSDCHAWADGKNLYQTSGSSEESEKQCSRGNHVEYAIDTKA